MNDINTRYFHPSLLVLQDSGDTQTLQFPNQWRIIEMCRGRHAQPFIFDCAGDGDGREAVSWDVITRVRGLGVQSPDANSPKAYNYIRMHCVFEAMSLVRTKFQAISKPDHRRRARQELVYPAGGG